MEEGRLCSCTKNHLLPRKYHYGILCYVVGSLATYPDLMNLMTDLILQITLDENFFQVNWATKTRHIFHIQNRRHRKISVSFISIYRIVVSTNKSRLAPHPTSWYLQIAYEGEIGLLCSVTFCGEVDFLISKTW